MKLPFEEAIHQLRLGAEAASLGHGLTTNPHPYGNERSRWWLRGWKAWVEGVTMERKIERPHP